jgi:hypothetical protein
VKWLKVRALSSRPSTTKKKVRIYFKEQKYPTQRFPKLFDLLALTSVTSLILSFIFLSRALGQNYPFTSSLRQTVTPPSSRCGFEM